MPSSTLLLLLQTVQVELTGATHLGKTFFTVCPGATARPLHFLRKNAFSNTQYNTDYTCWL